MLPNKLQTAIKTFVSFLIIELASSIKLSFVVGSRRLFFSGINCMGSFAESVAGGGALMLYALKRIMRSYAFGAGLFNPLVYHIPTLIASAYWFSSRFSVRVLLPLACIALFNLHPIGIQVTYYSWYWLIPVVIHFLPIRNPFFEALGTTFLAHALGSVLWIYSFSMPASYWTMLMPVVIIERLCFASGMTLVHYASGYITNNAVGLGAAFLNRIGLFKTRVVK